MTAATAHEIAKRDAQIARLEAEIQHKNEIIAVLVDKIERLKAR